MTPGPEKPRGDEVVLLLHGMGRTAASMRGMSRCLNAAGYRVMDWPYPSLTGSIQDHAARLHETLQGLDEDASVSRVHFVTHSLGGIIARQALLDSVPKKMGRLVMLAPPNRGSRVARRTAPLLGRWIKPLADLSDDVESAVNQLGVPPSVEIGIIAARRDGKVRVEDTHLPGEADHLVVPGFHTFIMNSPDVQNQVLQFLKSGRFAT